MASIGERIDAGIAARGWSQAELAREADLPALNYVSRIKSGELRARKHLEAIAAALGTTVEWLTVGSGAAPTWWQAPPAPVLMAAESSDALDLVGVVTAGDGNLEAYEPVQEPQPFPIPDSWKVVRVEGNSAYPVIYRGQFAVVDTNRAQRPPLSATAAVDLHDNIVLIQTEDGRGLLKRFCYAPGAPGDFILASVDSGRGSPYVPPDSILVIVPVVGTFYVDPTKPREKRWHNQTVVVQTPPVPGAR